MNRITAKTAGAARLVLLAGLLVVLQSCGGKRPWPLIAQADLRPADAIVVLGYGPPVDDAGQPVAELRRRVEQGVELYNAGYAPLMIVTGGNTYKDYYESAVMKDVAVSLGVPADAVVEERDAMDTIGNARGSARIMRERGLESCIVVSSPYHLRRARELFEAAGLDVQTAECATPSGLGYGMVFTLYELSVRVSYAFMDQDALVRGEDGGKK